MKKPHSSPKSEHRRTISPLWVSVCILAGIGLLAGNTGCQHVPPGGAKQLTVSFGIPGVFSIKKDMSGVDVTENNITVGQTSTDVQVALFAWHSSATDIAIPNPKKKGTP